ncbi:D-malate degradation protein R [Variovorax sp. SRS16]|uniref:LysR family transcriptional regulator n=1 Tax=Variovorax sp. SRS16 TaxID=282217 RepID=UPI0013179023|nr:LysR family transcriptional regulator [Variovorax sp. SRS16]VTU19357.1 D-malate degradation protein R [Variovorax sp. SRS16]
MDQIQGMRIFVRVVEAGTFTRAADSLGLPKGTVTKQIQALESRLRVKLLNRTTRRVTVTPDGAAYFERTARLLNDFDEIEASMTNAQANPTGRLRLDVGSAMARLVILPALSTFCDRYPDIQVDLGVSDRTVDLITDNVDCVIRGGDLTDQSLVARRIGTLPWMTVASPAYLKRYGTPQHPADIEKRHLVVSFFSGSTRRIFPHEFVKGDEHIELAGPYRVSVNDSNAHMTAVLGGFGISQVITYMAEPYIASGELVEILHDWIRPPLPVHVVYPPNRHLSAKVRAFVDWAAELFAKHPRLQRS